MIKVVRTSYKEVKDFSEREWRSADIEHYGKRLDWKKRKFILRAVEDGKTVGIIKVKMESGVADIESVLVAADKRGQGIGKALMLAAEEQAKKAGCHIVELVTGQDWKAVKFYEDLGYKKLSLIKRYYHQRDFIEFIKYI